MTIKRYKQEGFTLIETLVAISILLIAIVGPISVIGDSLHKIYYAKDEMIASNLAQEGIEYMRHFRDNGRLDRASFPYGLANVDYTIQISPATYGLTVCAPCDQKIYIDNTTGMYTQNSVGGTVTQFSRVINVSGDLTYKKITSTVTWVTGGGTGAISSTVYLFDLFQ